jgi:hypothetical protein
MITAAVATAALGLGAATASADVVNQAVVTCENRTATWQITLGATSYADVTHPPPAPGECKSVGARVEDDLDFAVSSSDLITSSYTKRLALLGAFVTGAPAFAGVGTSADGKVRGPIEIASEGVLNATITTVQSGLSWVAEYTPAGSCGPNCYTTKFTLVGTLVP